MCCCGTNLHHSHSEQKTYPTNQPKKKPQNSTKKRRDGINCSASQNVTSWQCNNAPACEALLCFNDWRNTSEKSAHDWKYKKADKKKMTNNFQVDGLLHLTCSKSIMNLLEDARSASHATTAEWQRNQKGWKSSPMSHLPNLSLLRWQVSQKDIIYAEINRCFIVSEMFLPRVISRLRVPTSSDQRSLPWKHSPSGERWHGAALWPWTPLPKYTNIQNKGDNDFCLWLPQSGLFCWWHNWAFTALKHLIACPCLCQRHGYLLNSPGQFE